MACPAGGPQAERANTGAVDGARIRPYAPETPLQTSPTICVEERLPVRLPSPATLW